jgi:hypothetical protein
VIGFWIASASGGYYFHLREEHCISFVDDLEDGSARPFFW